MNQGNKAEEALDACEHVLILRPRHAFAWNLKGYILEQLGRFTEQLTATERALDLKPNLARNWANKAAALTNLRRYDEALAACERGLAISPKDRFSLLAKAQMLEGMKRYDESLAVYDELISARHKHVASDCWRGKGSVLYKLGRYQEAAYALQQATLLDPNATASWRLLARTLRALGMRREAQEAQRKAQETEARPRPSGPAAAPTIATDDDESIDVSPHDMRQLSDADLYRTHYSPVCVYCRWWEPGLERHCPAFPEGGAEIPESIWDGEDQHVSPHGLEGRDARGRPYVFEPHPDVVRTADNAALLDAYAAVHAKDKHQ